MPDRPIPAEVETSTFSPAFIMSAAREVSLPDFGRKRSVPPSTRNCPCEGVPLAILE